MLIQRRLARFRTPAVINETRDINIASTGNGGVLGLSIPSTAVIPQTAGRTLLEHTVTMTVASFAGSDPQNSFLTFGQLA